MNGVVATDENGNILSSDMYVGNLHFGSTGLGFNLHQLIVITVLVGVLLLGLFIYYIISIKRSRAYEIYTLDRILDEVGIGVNSIYEVKITRSVRILATFYFDKGQGNMAATYEVNDETIEQMKSLGINVTDNIEEEEE
jgi:hypothetical protein